MVNKMKKIFKSKHKTNINIKKILLFLLISFFSAYFLSKMELFKNEKVINILKNTSINKLNDINIDFKGEYLLNVGLSSLNKIKFSKTVFEEKKKEENNFQIYIYNTHQTEEYRTIENYNLTPTVHTAAFILKDKLKEYNINAIVETSDIKEELNKNGYNYNQSYIVSENWLKKLNRNDLDLYIDLHRDSINYNLSNVMVDGKDYAKIMFVVGTNYDYEENMNVAKKIIEEIENINPKISRGVFTRYSTYNQDFNKNCVLIEVGGPESTYESISNSLGVLSEAINNYLKG